jgi:hypothetical protein
LVVVLTLMTAGFTASASFANDPLAADAAGGGGAVTLGVCVALDCAWPAVIHPPVSPSPSPTARTPANSADLFIA